MFALARLAVVGFIVLTVIYIIISIWSRQVRRSKLKKRWKEEGMTGDRDAFIREGLDDYDDSFRRKLILLVYIIPVALVITIIYVMNFM